MPPVPRNEEHEQALALRAAEVRAQALGDEDFMQQIYASMAALARGERGTPLRDLPEKDHPKPGQ